MHKHVKTPFSNSLTAIAAFCALLLAVMLCIILFSRQDTVRINEIMISNQSYYPGSESNYPDWIELYNPLDKEINLSGYFLTDDPGNLEKWKIPDLVILPGQFCVLESGNDISRFFNFGLSSNDRYVILSNPDGRIINSVLLAAADSDESWAFTGSDWSISVSPTPGYPNDENGYSLYLDQVTARNYPIRLNEYCPSNNSSVVDELGNTPDWIEIFNYGDDYINLKGFGLSDRLDSLMKWTFPEIIIAPGSYQVVFASGSDIKKNTSLPHTNFRLNDSKDKIYLSDPNGRIIDSVEFADFPENAQSAGIVDNHWLYFRESSAGKANGHGYDICRDIPEFSVNPGFYPGKFSLEIKGEAGIRYTIDGSDPVSSSEVYSGPLSIENTCVVKARIFKPGCLPGGLLSGTFFINAAHTLPVVSVSLAPDLLFSEEKGLYVMGPHPGSVFPYTSANFWQEWEYPAQIEMYSGDKAKLFSISGGLKIFGAFSRALPQKSFVVKLRNEYGYPRLNYQLFPEKQIYSFESFVLRAGGQDSQRTKLRDLLVAKLACQMGLEAMDGYPVVLYLNGEYWGVYNMREKIEDSYLAGNTGRPDKHGFNLVQANRTILAGSNGDYDEIRSFISSHSLAVKENYEWVCDRVDVKNYADYHAVQVYSGNVDAGNIRRWKGNAPGDKWRWIVFDADWSFYSPASRVLDHWLNPDGRGWNRYFSTLLITKLLENPDFRDLFITRFIYHLDHTLTSENVTSLIKTYSGYLAPEMPAQIARWGLVENETWEEQVNQLLKFAEKRTEYVFLDLMKHFKLTANDLDKFRDSEYYTE